MKQKILDILKQLNILILLLGYINLFFIVVAKIYSWCTKDFSLFAITLSIITGYSLYKIIKIFVEENIDLFE